MNVTVKNAPAGAWARVSWTSAAERQTSEVPITGPSPWGRTFVVLRVVSGMVVKIELVSSSGQVLDSASQTVP